MSVTSIRGVAAEYQAAILLSSIGYAIHWPIDPSSPYDLLASKGHDYLKIQVKLARWRKHLKGDNSSLIVDSSTPSRSTKKGYSYGDFDLLCAIDGQRGWLIPFEDCLGRKNLSLDRRGPSPLLRNYKTYNPDHWLVKP